MNANDGTSGRMQPPPRGGNVFLDGEFPTKGDPGVEMTPPSRGERYLEKTLLEDEMEEIRPTLVKRRNWGGVLVGFGLASLMFGLVTGKAAPGIFSCVIFLVLSLAQWLFYGFARAEMKGLQVAAADIQKSLEEGGPP